MVAEAEEREQRALDEKEQLRSAMTEQHNGLQTKHDKLIKEFAELQLTLQARRAAGARVAWHAQRGGRWVARAHGLVRAGGVARPVARSPPTCAASMLLPSMRRPSMRARYPSTLLRAGCDRGPAAAAGRWRGWHARHVGPGGGRGCRSQAHVRRVLRSHDQLRLRPVRPFGHVRGVCAQGGLQVRGPRAPRGPHAGPARSILRPRASPPG